MARQFTEASFGHLALMNAGPGFFEFYATELAAPPRRLSMIGRLCSELKADPPEPV